MGDIRKDMSGQRFGRLVVLSASHTDKWGIAHWRCRCDCGNETVVAGASLRSGVTQSCRCIHREVTAKRSLSHGQGRRNNRTSTFNSWRSIKDRCLNPNVNEYPNYGGRGVTICDRWRHSFENFLADMGERPAGTSLDRINPFGNYEPENCRWADAKTQANNTRKNWTRLHGN